MSDITLKQAIQCMESLCGTLNDRDNDCLRILIDSLEESRKDQERYRFVRNMTPEQFENTSTIHEDFDHQIDAMIKGQQ